MKINKSIKNGIFFSKITAVFLVFSIVFWLLPGNIIIAEDSQNPEGLEETEIIPEVDVSPPVITLVGDATMNLKIGDVYEEAGATAIDDVDGDITKNIIVGGDSVDTSVSGTYIITYNVNDSAGNAAGENTEECYSRRG